MKSKTKRGIIQRYMRCGWIKHSIRKGILNERQAKRWLSNLYDEGELNG